MEMKLQTKSVLGISISDESIEIAEVAQGNVGFKVLRLSRAELKKGAIDHGLVKNLPEFRKKLKQILTSSDSSRITAYEAVFSISMSAADIFVDDYATEIPNHEVSSLIEKKATSLIFENLEEKYKFYQLISHPNGSRLVFGVTGRPGLDTILSEIRLAGLKVLGIEVEIYSLVRSVVESFEEEKCCLFVDINANSTVVTIFDSIGLSMNTILPVGGRSITDAISHSTQLDYLEAEKIKNTFGIGDSDYKDAIVEPISMLLDKIVREVKENIVSYQESKKRKIAKVYICGSVSLTKGILEYFQKKMTFVKVELADTWVEHSKVKETPVLFLKAIGLALKGLNYNGKLGQGNLLNVVEVESNQEKKNSSPVSGKIGKSDEGEGDKKEFLDKKSLTVPKSLKGKIYDENDKTEKSLKVENMNNKSGKNFFKTILKRPNIVKSRNRIISENQKPLKDLNKKNFILGSIPIRKNKKVLFFLAFFVMLIIFIGILLFITRNHTKEELDTLVGEDEYNLAKSLSIDLSISTDSNNLIDYRIVELQKIYSQEFESTGHGVQDQYVKGTVEINNLTSTKYNLVSKSRLSTQEGKIYRLDNPLTLEANTKINVSITANEEGIAYEIPAGTKLTFPGLGVYYNDLIYGIVITDLKIQEIRAVTDTDIINAENELNLYVAGLKSKDVNSNSESGYIVSEELLDTTVEKIEFDQVEGNESPVFSGNVFYKVLQLELSLADIEQILKGELEITAGSEYTGSYIFKEITVNIEKYDVMANLLDLNIYANAEKF